MGFATAQCAAMAEHKRRRNNAPDVYEANEVKTVHAEDPAKEQALRKTCEALIRDDLIWIERKLDEIGNPCTSEQRRQARCFRVLLDKKTRKLNGLQHGDNA